MSSEQLTCVCGKKYWRAQAWQHDKCVVVNKVPLASVVVNAATTVVVNKRTKDRHRKTPERLEYIRKKMRALRARSA